MFITTLDFRNNFEKEKKILCCYELANGVPFKNETNQKENEIYRNETKRNDTKQNKKLPVG